MPRGRKPIYASLEERKAAARVRQRLRDLGTKLENARRRHHDVVKEVKRADMDGLLAPDEKEWT